MVDSPATGFPKERDERQPKLALRPREAASALGISERLLWSITNRGEIPHVKLGRVTLYPVDVLRDWLDAKAAKGQVR